MLRFRSVSVQYQRSDRIGNRMFSNLIEFILVAVPIAIAVSACFYIT